MPDSDRSRILILAQTNPTLSHKYTETVCTAGIEEISPNCYQWIRLYPIKKRYLSENQKYKKYQWISCKLNECDRNRDKRPESRKVYIDTIKPENEISTGKNRDWIDRRHILLHSGLPIIRRITDLLEGAKKNEFSLCLFKPEKIVSFFAKEQRTEFTPEELEIIEEARNDEQLLEPDYDFKKVNFSKIPYNFKCHFRDIEGKSSTLSVLDWEMSTLFRKALRKKGNKELAKKDTLDQYNEFIEKKDVYLILGTRHKDHNTLIKHPNSKKNPWSIISVIYFPVLLHGEQLLLGV